MSFSIAFTDKCCSQLYICIGINVLEMRQYAICIKMFDFKSSPLKMLTAYSRFPNIFIPLVPTCLKYQTKAVSADNV